MAGTVANFITTSLLTLTCATILFIAYRIALRPILQSIPLQTLFAGRSGGRVMLPDDGAEAGALEEGFRDDSDEEGEGDVRVGR
ncbi:uncharacterized protein H6S33_012293 [Morchella sextelata]|uniref:uncharacterized protein n=1 Tax=Morchella sextelata TaxID=1174677 RepID=UPI001D0374BA|nr:uncharacterized protein H6S33_012293 [Morchella sextelata]KAH0609747.1 hypothetical protein H6S33_012293 [Morchella sextelata]